MRSARSIQITIVALVAGLAAFLFLNGKNNSTALINSGQHANASPDSVQAMENDGFDFALLEKDVKAKLSKADADEIMMIENAISGKGNTLDNTLKLADKYNGLGHYAIAGYYYQKVAEQKPKDEKNWANAGHAYFRAQDLATEEKTYNYFVGLSQSAYDKALKLNPNNIDAKIEQGVNITRSGGAPMKGIGLLKEVEQTEPDNRKMLFYLGALSVKSGQMDKALERFEKLTRLPKEKDDNMYPFYFRYLGETYQKLGQNDKALIAFKQYRQLVEPLGDTGLKQEADQLIRSAQ